MSGRDLAVVVSPKLADNSDTILDTLPGGTLQEYSTSSRVTVMMLARAKLGRMQYSRIEQISTEATSEGNYYRKVKDDFKDDFR